MSLTINALPVSVMLKNATQSLHTEVENLLLPKLSSIQSHADYAAVLKMFYGYFSPVESRVQQYITAILLPDINTRRKAAAILNDLQAIGCSTAAIPLCSNLPTINNVHHAFGVMYVLEGSTLGGKMIAKMLQKNNAVSIPGNALHFFEGYREETGSKWKAFLETLNQQSQVDDVAKAANETFYYLKGWMQHTLVNVKD